MIHELYPPVQQNNKIDECVHWAVIVSHAENRETQLSKLSKNINAQKVARVDKEKNTMIKAGR